MNTVIAISGQKRSGKDELARAIMTKNSSFIKTAFADPVRDAAKAFFGWDDSVFDDEHKEKIDRQWGISPRQALQFIGTEVGRLGFAEHFPQFNLTTGNNLWINRTRQFIQESEYNVIVSDVRFVNELYALVDLEKKGYKVITVGLRRPGANGDNHASEREVEDCIQRSKYEFENKGTLEDLNRFADAVLFGEEILFNRGV